MSKPVVLKVFRNGGVVDVKQFTQEHQIILGSADADTHVKLPGAVSPFHASIEKRGDKYYLSDLGSSQGTYLKGSKILEAALEHGDKIAIGEYIIEFYVGAPTVSASTTAAPPAAAPTPVNKPIEMKPVQAAPTISTSVAQAPVHMGTQALPDMGVQASPTGDIHVFKKKKKKGEKTFAPPSVHKNLSEFIKPTKGGTIEILVAWKERIINSYHFNKKGTVHFGTHPSCEVLLPSLNSKVSKAPLVQIDGQATVFVPPGMMGSLVADNTTTPLSQLFNTGRLQSSGSGSRLNLMQGEMLRMQMGGDLEVVVRYASDAPKPLFIPMIDFTSNGFLAVLLAAILAIVTSLYVSLNHVENKEVDEEEFRTALIIDNPPKPPPVVPQPKEEPPKVEEKKIEPPPKKEVVKIEPKKEPAKVVEIKKQEPKREAVKQAPPRVAQKAGGGDQSAAKSMRANPNKPKSNQMGSVKQGGAVKVSNKEGAQAESITKDPKKSGIFGVFGSGGANNRLDNTYSGGGELSGLADKASGSAGSAEDRAGEGLGSKFKETGGGQGKSNVGVGGISTGKGLGPGTGGFGGVGLGGKGTVTILPGGDAETSGGDIDRNGIRQVFIQNQRALQACYERALSTDKGLGGKLVLDFDIGEQGRVLRAEMSRGKSTLVNDELAGCVISRMKNWRFPEPPKNQTVQVFYPLAFSNN
ncbi:MAG: AgmX/PglI C-terminal domain-containing protein [Bdellovibrionales bacterium]|nr:AgmX/PglI C-terminal domain-containing protein [Bdellovibrionales bacterium]